MYSLEIHKRFMREALREAVKAADAGEVPTGCVIVRTDKVRGQGVKGLRDSGVQEVRGSDSEAYPLTPEPLNPLIPSPLNPLTPEPLNPLTPEPLNPLTPQIIARAHNQTELLKDATAHAEILAITQASAAIGDWRLTGTILYVTKEPCAMCAGAIVLSRIPLVVWGFSDPLRGGHSVFSILNHDGLNHRPEIIPGVLEPDCREMFQAFFRERRGECSQLR